MAQHVTAQQMQAEDTEVAKTMVSDFNNGIMNLRCMCCGKRNVFNIDEDYYKCERCNNINVVIYHKVEAATNE
jgi:Zn finger protein HypA/HybF involved in hydrogenase expression